MAFFGGERSTKSQEEKIMKEKGYKRITVRIYKPEIIREIETVPRGFRSAMVQAALLAYIKAGKHTTFQGVRSEESQS